MRRPLLLGLALLLAACNGSGSSGPSTSSIVIESETLVPCVASGRFCCVRTQLVNTSSHTLDVAIRWRAFNAQGIQFADALDFIAGVAPHTRLVSTSAFFGSQVESCSQIARFERFDVDVF
jgi:hypothetical protein